MVVDEKMRKRMQDRIEALGRFSSSDGPGVTRLPFTDEYREAVLYLKKEMSDIGLKVKEDASGAVIGRLEGARKQAVVIGSHLDTVENGGRFDGQAGIVCGLAAIELLMQDKAVPPPYSVEIIATNDEEGVRFSSGFFSSKAMTGDWTMKEFYRQTDRNGISLYDAMLQYGLDPERVLHCKRPKEEVLCFIEPHIEQGRVLEEHKKEIGIVSGIVGIHRMMVTISGRPDHAGTTPMHMRRDAVNASAKVISMLEDIANHYEDMVITCGFISASPNVINTIAGEAHFSIDMRSLKEEDLKQAFSDIMEVLRLVAEKTKTGYAVGDTLYQKPLLMDKTLSSYLEELCCSNGYSWERIKSGAGHDSLVIGRRWPAAMIFLPSAGGRSHCPEEFTDYESLAKAAVLLAGILEKLK